MPHFDVNGCGTWICQFCAGIYPDTVRSVWVKYTESGKPHGNKCPECAGTGKANLAVMPDYYYGEDY